MTNERSRSGNSASAWNTGRRGLSTWAGRIDEDGGRMEEEGWGGNTVVDPNGCPVGERRYIISPLLRLVAGVGTTILLLAAGVGTTTVLAV